MTSENLQVTETKGALPIPEPVDLPDHFENWWAACGFRDSHADSYSARKQLAWEAFHASHGLAGTSRQAEANAHAEYLEAMADVVHTSGKAGLVETAAVMRKAARFLMGPEPARAKPQANALPSAALRSAVGLLLFTLRKHRRWVNSGLATDEIAEINDAVRAANGALAKADGSVRKNR